MLAGIVLHYKKIHNILVTPNLWHYREYSARTVIISCPGEPKSCHVLISGTLQKMKSKSLVRKKTRGSKKQAPKGNTEWDSYKRKEQNYSAHDLFL